MSTGRDDIFDAVYQVILDRKANPSESSYTASLMGKGIDKVLKKFAEEAAELVIAGKGGERSEIVYEAADVVFHLLVVLGFSGVGLDEVKTELSRRFGISGIAEKASREEAGS